MAGFAALLELAFVGIGVAGGAGGKLQTEVFWLAIVAADVALFAGHFQVEVLRVDLGVLPTSGRVALRATRPKAALVLVFVTSDAVGGKAKPGVIQNLGCEQQASGGSRMLRVVAGSALYPDMLTVEYVSSLCVTESLWRRYPMNHLKVFPVMIRVAFNAGCAWRSRAWEGSVKSMIPLQLAGDLDMAFETAKVGRSSGNNVTFGAIGRSVQILVSLGQRPRRNLRTSNAIARHD
jgi:hypothetical protein